MKKDNNTSTVSDKVEIKKKKTKKQKATTEVSDQVESGFINLELHKNTSFNNVLGADDKLANIKVEKPAKDVWFRSHPDFHQDLYIAEAAINRSSIRKQSYLVNAKTKAKQAELLNALDIVRYTKVALICTSTQVLQLWPIKLFTGEGDPLLAHTSALEAWEDSKEGYIKMFWAGGKYDWRLPNNPKVFNEPQWPQNKTLMRILELGFRNNVISEMDHPVVQYANGEAN